MNNLEDKFPVIIKIPVLWGHMDAFRHLNNVIYFRFFESARIAYFEEIGFLKYMNYVGIGPILASTECKYIKPITYPDTAIIGAKVIEIKEDRFYMEYAISSINKKVIAALGKANVVSYNYKENKKVKLPKEIKGNILKLEGTLEKNEKK